MRSAADQFQRDNVPPGADGLMHLLVFITRQNFADTSWRVERRSLTSLQLPRGLLPGVMLPRAQLPRGLLPGVLPWALLLGAGAPATAFLAGLGGNLRLPARWAGCFEPRPIAPDCPGAAAAGASAGAGAGLAAETDGLTVGAGAFTAAANALMGARTELLTWDGGATDGQGAAETEDVATVGVQVTLGFADTSAATSWPSSRSLSFSLMTTSCGCDLACSSEGFSSHVIASVSGVKSSSLFARRRGQVGSMAGNLSTREMESLIHHGRCTDDG